MHRTNRNDLQAKKWFDSFRRRAGEGCPRCGRTKAYRLRDGRLRCPDCAYTYHEYTGRWINRGRIDLGAWRELLAFFAQGKTPNQTARAMRINRDTVRKAYTTIRSALLAMVTKSKDMFNESGDLIRFCPNLESEGDQVLCQGCRAYVFALRLNGSGRAKLNLVPGVKARGVLSMPLDKKSWRRLVITDAFKGQTGLVFACCPRGLELFCEGFASRSFALERHDGFFVFADDWFAHHRYFSPEHYPLYLAEIVFRYNHAGLNLMSFLAKSLCRFVSEPGQ
jgi:transposase